MTYSWPRSTGRASTAASLAALLLLFALLLAGLSRSSLNWDVALFLQQAQLILKGQVPFLDFWDVNPPWIMILNLVPALLAKCLGLPIAFAFNACVCSLLLASLALVRGTSFRFFPVAAAILLEAVHAMAIGEFGQREHLFAIAFVPYFMVRWDGGAQKFMLWASVFLCAVFALLKPDFVLLLLASELIFSLRTRGLNRGVLAAMALPACLYLALFLELPLQANKNFWFEHVPLLWRGYAVFDASWAELYRTWRPYFFLVPWLSLSLCFIGREESPEKRMRSSLGVLIPLAFVLALAARKNWAYHLLVTDSLCCLGVALLLLAPRSCKSITWTKIAILLAPVAVLYGSEEMSYLRVPANMKFARQSYKRSLAHLLDFAKAGDQVVIFATEPYSIYPELLERGLWPGIRYPIQFPLAIFNSTESRIQLLKTRYPTPADLEPLERAFVDRVSEDLLRNKPELLVFFKRFTPYLPSNFNSFEYAKSVGWFEPLRDFYQVATEDSDFLLLKRRATPAAGDAERPEKRSGPAPTHAAISYAPSNSGEENGHLLDLYLPAPQRGKIPVVVWTHGSAWKKDNGREQAEAWAAILNPKGYAVAGVSIRSSGQTLFPGQLHDIKAAIRWLRTNSEKFNFDPNRIGIVGDSSGGWAAAMAAVTGGEPKLEGKEGAIGVSSGVQAAIAFYPVTDFSMLDPWALRPCDKKAKGFDRSYCHDVPESPESLLLGCAPAKCSKKVKLASPIQYIGSATPPLMIIHGGNDQFVNHAQGEALYQALNKACSDAVFISLPLAEHGDWTRMLTDEKLQYGATIRSTTRQGCIVSIAKPVKPSWEILTSFFDKYLKSQDNRASAP